MVRKLFCFLLFSIGNFAFVFSQNKWPENFFETHCYDCHDKEVSKGGLDLTSFSRDLTEVNNFEKWLYAYDRIKLGEMPPKERKKPSEGEKSKGLNSLKSLLLNAEAAIHSGKPKTKTRRLTRSEYENTIRDLFQMPGIALKEILPEDGSIHGYDKQSMALDLSHVNLSKYMEAADHVLDLAIATRPVAPVRQKRKISLANRGGFVAHIIMNGDGVLLRDMKPDPAFPPAGRYNHVNQGAHEKFGSFRTGSTVGLFRHEDESVSPYFMEHVTLYPGIYKVRTSLWSFQWEKGKVLPSRGTEAARLSVVRLTGDGRGGGHPSYVLGYFDAPSLKPQLHELKVWLNHNELIGFNAASLAPTANYNRKGRAMAFTGPGIAVDWLEVDGPIHQDWPPPSHKLLFGELPIVEFDKDKNPETVNPKRIKIKQLGAGMNRRDAEHGTWSVHSKSPVTDARTLLVRFLPKAFRRKVSDLEVEAYLLEFEKRMKARDSFESAMRWVYRAVLCSPDFLFHFENENQLSPRQLANRMSYFLWNSLPDERLVELSESTNFKDPNTLVKEVDRMLDDPKSERFVHDFLDQWLELRSIGRNDPDRKLYPEFSPYLQDSMVQETRAFFRQMLEDDLNASHLIRSSFAMLNEKLANHYGISGVEGSVVRRVVLPPNHPRGPFLTHASVLKITANGTTTSPVPRGAFVMDKLLGNPIPPPPSNVPAIEPDVSGAKTIRQQLDLHRNQVACRGCHAKMDPPGFALESFDVIGGQRNRYRTIGNGDRPERGNIDPFVGLSFLLGQKVESSGELLDGRKFSSTEEFQDLIAEDDSLSLNLLNQLQTYSIGRGPFFSDREEQNEILSEVNAKNGGLRSLIKKLVCSTVFEQK